MAAEDARFHPQVLPSSSEKGSAEGMSTSSMQISVMERWAFGSLHNNQMRIQRYTTLQRKNKINVKNGPIGKLPQIIKYVYCQAYQVSTQCLSIAVDLLLGDSLRS